MSIDTVAKLKSFKLHGMAQSWPELVAQARHAEFEPEQFMEQLLLVEGAEREVRQLPIRRRRPSFRRIATWPDSTLLRSGAMSPWSASSMRFSFCKRHTTWC